ncbi:MAG: glycosyltransferase [Flavobacterium sp.]|nr:MAG: glycosyltransferase [Flavobacterium sp.]
MLQTRKIKLCLVGDMLSGGGAERVHAILSEFFVSKGLEVHNVIVTDRITYSYSGSLLNLGLLKNSSNGFLNKLKRFRVLSRYISSEKFDFIIDFRMRRKPLQDLLIAKIIYTAPAIYTVHSSRLEWYLPRNKWLTNAIYGKAFGLVAITEKTKQRIQKEYGLKNVSTIYNPVDTAQIGKQAALEFNAPDYKYILAAGGMSHDGKQFDKLMDAYAQSVLPGSGVKLIILGDGEKRNKLEEYAGILGLDDMIVFAGFQDNPYVYMRHSLFFVMSSKFEGLPMVLIESLACGTPVISFDCPTGPSEIIEDRVNGLLIEDQNFDKLTDGMNVLYQDIGLFEKCKSNAVTSIQKFTVENIGRQWLDYLKIDLN